MPKVGESPSIGPQSQSLEPPHNNKQGTWGNEGVIRTKRVRCQWSYSIIRQYGSEKMSQNKNKKVEEMEQKQEDGQKERKKR